MMIIFILQWFAYLAVQNHTSSGLHAKNKSGETRPAIRTVLGAGKEILGRKFPLRLAPKSRGVNLARFHYLPV
jgi:hypothetical protein